MHALPYRRIGNLNTELRAGHMLARAVITGVKVWCEAYGEHHAKGTTPTEWQSKVHQQARGGRKGLPMIICIYQLYIAMTALPEANTLLRRRTSVTNYRVMAMIMANHSPSWQRTAACRTAKPPPNEEMKPTAL